MAAKQPPCRAVRLTLAVLCALGVATTPAAGQGRLLHQAGAPRYAPGAVIGTKHVDLPPPLTFKTGRSGVNTANGAYVGCFDTTKPGVTLDTSTQKSMNPITGCGAYCDGKIYAFTVIRTNQLCVCTNVMPLLSAKVADSVCDGRQNPNVVAMFYNHKNAASVGCGIRDVAMAKTSFLWAYNEYLTSFKDGVMTLKMEGPNGERLYHPTALQYGMAQVRARISDASGAVSAFYLRSDTQQETKDFSEIDFEFLNANPGRPGSFWLNSFYNGQSYGEQMIPPSEYMPKLGTSCSVAGCYYTFTIHWQPNQVVWLVNNKIMRRNYYDQNVRWCDMNGACKERKFRPPTKPSFPTFSMWHDTDNGGSFGGQLGPGSPYYSSFQNLRLVVCDKPLSNYNGPTWTYQGGSSGGGGGSPAPTPSPAPQPKPSPAPQPKPSPSPVPQPKPSPSPGGGCSTSAAAWNQCGGKGGTCAAAGAGACADAKWPGVCCPTGYTCVRSDQYYWQCRQ